MKKKSSKLLALLLAVSMVVPNGAGMNVMTVQAEEVIVDSEYPRFYVEIENGVLERNAYTNSYPDSNQWGDGPAAYAFDDDRTNNKWHTYYSVNNSTEKGKNHGTLSVTNPVWIQTAFEESRNIGKITYIGRTGGNTYDTTDDNIKDYTIQYVNLPEVKLDEDGNLPEGIDWIDAQSGTLERGELGQEHEIKLEEVITATHIRIKITSNYEGNNVVASSIRIYATEEVGEARTELLSRIIAMEQEADKVTSLTEEEKAILDTAKDKVNTSGLSDEEYYEQIENLRNIWTEYKIHKWNLRLNAAASTEQDPPMGSDGADGPARYAFNNKLNDWWHTKYDPQDEAVIVTADKPAWLETGFDESVWVSKIVWTPRSGKSGNSIKTYQIQAANLADPLETPTDADYVLVTAGTFPDTTDGTREVSLEKPVKATHIRLKVIKTGSNDGTGHVCIAECDVWKKDVKEVLLERINFVDQLSDTGDALSDALEEAKSAYDAEYDSGRLAEEAYEEVLDNLDEKRIDSVIVALDEEITLTREAEQTLNVGTLDALFEQEKVIEWSSSNETVATVDANGRVTAVAPGTAEITATLRVDESKTATCTVKVEPKQYQITVTADINGAVEFENGMYDEDTPITVTAVPNDGYEFKNWTDEMGVIISTNPIYQFTVENAVTLKANFEEANIAKLAGFTFSDNVIVNETFAPNKTSYTGTVTSTKTTITATATKETETISLTLDDVPVEPTEQQGKFEVYLPTTVGGINAESCTLKLTVRDSETGTFKEYEIVLSEGKYLSDMDWDEATEGWTEGIKKDSNYQGGRITLQTESGVNKEFTKGIGTHAPSEIVYNISSLDYDVFEAYVGVNKPHGTWFHGFEAFEVYVDDVLKYTSGRIEPATAMKHVVVKGLKDANKLKLVVKPNSASDKGDAHANWADAKLTNGFVASVETITLDRTVITLAKGTTDTLAATTNPVVTDEINKFTWTSSEEEVATVDANGVVTAIAPGETTITVTTEDGKEASCIVKVPEVNVETIILDEEEIVLEYKAGAAIQKTKTLVATVTPENHTSAITWTSSNPQVATVVNGVITPLTVGTTTITVTAQNLDGTNSSDECKVTVLKNVALDAYMEGENLDTNPNPNFAFRWTSDGTNAKETGDAARISNLAVDGDTSNDSYVGFGNGAQSQGNGDIKSSYMELNLGEVNELKEIRLHTYLENGRKYDKVAIAVSERADFKDYKVLYTADNPAAEGYANVHNLDLDENTIIGENIESNEALIVTLNEEIRVRYIRVYMFGSNKNGANHIAELVALGTDLNETDVTQIELEKQMLTLNKGTTVALSATVTPEGAVDPYITWSSDNTAVATVDADGNITAVAAGTAKITATAANGLVTASCDVTVRDVFSVAVSSIDKKTGQTGIVTLTGGGTYYTDDMVTIKAPVKVGYEFKGWYAPQDTNNYTGEPLCADYTWTFAAENKELVAVYEATPEYRVLLTITDNANYVTVGGVEVETDEYSEYIKVGTVEITYNLKEGETFLYWKNGSGKIVSTNASDTFDLINNTTLTPVVQKGTVGTSALVEYVNEYNQVLLVETWESNGSNTLSTATPSKLGYTFAGWALSTEPTEQIDAGAVRTAILNSNYIRLVPVYTPITVNDEDKLTIYYYDGVEKQEQKVAIGETCTVIAAKKNGEQFKYWKIGDKVVSYNESYTFLVTEDTPVGEANVLTAEFVTDAEDVQKESILEISSQYEVMNGDKKVEKVAFVASREIAEGDTLLEHGMLYAKNSELAEAAFVESADGVGKFTASGTGKNGAFTLNVRISDDTSNIKVRAYAIIKKADGTVTTIYSKLSTYTNNATPQ